MCELLTGDHCKVGADLDKVGSDNKGVAMSFGPEMDQWCQ